MLPFCILKGVLCMSISENQAQRLNRSMPIAKDTSLGNIIKGLEEKVALIPKRLINNQIVQRLT